MKFVEVKDRDGDYQVFDLDQVRRVVRVTASVKGNNHTLVYLQGGGRIQFEYSEYGKIRDLLLDRR